MNRLEEFLGGREVSFTEMTSELVDSFGEYLHDRNISRNTTSFYMRILRAVYNRGVDKGWTSQRSLFRHVYTGVDRANHRIINMLL